MISVSSWRKTEGAFHTLMVHKRKRDLQSDSVVTTLLSLYYTINYLIRENTDGKEKKKMKISSMLQRTVKQEGKHSLTSKTIVKLKNSKEFNYLVDKDR